MKDMYVVALRVLNCCSMIRANVWVLYYGSGYNFKNVKKTRSSYILHVETWKLPSYRFSSTMNEDSQIL